jgi:hypothetical protein
VTDLDFTCVPGDMILVRTRAMRTGHSPLLDKGEYSVGEWNVLGDCDYVQWNDISDAHLPLCTVIAVVEFPIDVSSLDYLVLLTANGIAYTFNDPHNGFWIPVEQEVGELARPFPRVDSGPHGRPAPRSVVETTEQRREALRPTPRDARRESQSAWYTEIYRNRMDASQRYVRPKHEIVGSSAAPTIVPVCTKYV